MEKTLRTNACPGGRTQDAGPAPARMAYPAKRRYPAETPEQLVFNCLDHGAHPVLGGYKGPNKLDAPDRAIWDARLGPLLAASGLLLEELDVIADQDEELFFGKGGRYDPRHAWDPGHRGMAELCFAEWVLAKMQPSPGVRALRRAGLAPSIDAACYLDALGGSFLSLYEVQAVQGSRALLADLLDEEAMPVWADLSDTGIHLLQWDIAGLRLLSWQDRIHVGSGAIFFDRPYGADLARTLKAGARRRRSASPLDAKSALQRDLRIVQGWFAEMEGDAVIAAVDMIPAPGRGRSKAQTAQRYESLRWTYESLVRMSLPELGGKSIAQAAGLKTRRALAAEWLKHFENAEARRGMEGMDDLPAPLDLGWLWDMLRLERWPEQVRAALEQGPES